MNAGRLSRNKVKIAPRTNIKIKANMILTIYTKVIGLDTLLAVPGTPATWDKKVKYEENKLSRQQHLKWIQKVTT